MSETIKQNTCDLLLSIKNKVEYKSIPAATAASSRFFSRWRHAEHF